MDDQTKFKGIKAGLTALILLAAIAILLTVPQDSVLIQGTDNKWANVLIGLGFYVAYTRFVSTGIANLLVYDSYSVWNKSKTTEN